MSALANPLHEAQRFVGMPYEAGVFDCVDLAVLVQWEVFGCRVTLPGRRTRPRGAMGQAREISRYQATLAEPIDGPRTGAGVLLVEPHEPAPLWHVGTVFVQGAAEGGEVWVLHNSEKLGGAALQRLEDLRRFGMRVEGFYQWKQ